MKESEAKLVENISNYDQAVKKMLEAISNPTSEQAGEA